MFYRHATLFVLPAVLFTIAGATHGQGVFQSGRSYSYYPQNYYDYSYDNYAARGLWYYPKDKEKYYKKIRPEYRPAKAKVRIPDSVISIGPRWDPYYGWVYW